jgi:cyclopropane fatty-acyl-phospholipid synthase-like methyltransferase
VLITLSHPLRRIRVHLMDYRDIPATFEKSFDTFISIEMLEVGARQSHCLYTQRVSSMLAHNTTPLSSNWSILHSSHQMQQWSSVHRHFRNAAILNISALTPCSLDIYFMALTGLRILCAVTCGRILRFLVLRV